MPDLRLFRARPIPLRAADPFAPLFGLAAAGLLAWSSNHDPDPCTAAAKRDAARAMLGDPCALRRSHRRLLHGLERERAARRQPARVGELHELRGAARFRVAMARRAAHSSEV